jgi:hypothetical protein
MTDTTQAPEISIQKCIDWASDKLRWGRAHQLERHAIIAHLHHLVALETDLAQPPPIVSGVTDGEALLARGRKLITVMEDMAANSVGGERASSAGWALSIVRDLVSTLSRTTDQSQ